MRGLRYETSPVKHTLIPIGGDWYSLPVREIKVARSRAGFKIDDVGIGAPPYRLVRTINQLEGDRWSWRDSFGNPVLTTTQAFGTYRQCMEWGDAVEAGKRPPINPEFVIQWRGREWVTDGKICVELSWLYSTTDDRECCYPFMDKPAPTALDNFEKEAYAKCLPCPDEDLAEYRAYLHTETRRIFHLFVPQRSTIWTALEVEATMGGLFRGTINGEAVVYQMRVGDSEVERWRK